MELNVEGKKGRGRGTYIDGIEIDMKILGVNG